MDNKIKAEIINQFVTDNIENPDYEDYFTYNDLGIPLTVAFINDLCNLTERGVEILGETYTGLCNLLQVDEKESYEDIDDFFEDSIIGDEEEE